MSRPIISIVTDFGVQSQGVGIMESVAFQICPNAKYINLMHGLPSFNLSSAARTLETVKYLPVGFHICVCDPGVGSKRRPIIIETARGDYLIGPDNGVLLPAARILGGAVKCNIIENLSYMLHPISPIFHGRDVFVPAAAHLANGVEPKKFGQKIAIEKLISAPYEEAEINNRILHCEIIHINHFGSIILNILHQSWDNLSFSIGSKITLKTKDHDAIPVIYGNTFSDVPRHHDVLMKDDYGRIEIATNHGTFYKKYSFKLADTVQINLP